MGVSKVVYDGKTLIDLTTITVTADKLALGETAINKAGELITGTMSTNNDNILVGSFTPTSTSGTYQINVPKMPRAILVKAHSIDTSVDRYELQALSIVNPNLNMSNGNSVLVSARYKSSTSNGSTYSQASAYNAYSWNSSYTGTSASQYYYAVCVTASKIYFKQSGNYRFRNDVQYDYYIVFD